MDGSCREKDARCLFTLDENEMKIKISDVNATANRIDAFDKLIPFKF